MISYIYTNSYFTNKLIELFTKYKENDSLSNYHQALNIFINTINNENFLKNLEKNIEKYNVTMQHIGNIEDKLEKILYNKIKYSETELIEYFFVIFYTDVFKCFYQDDTYYHMTRDNSFGKECNYILRNIEYLLNHLSNKSYIIILESISNLPRIQYTRHIASVLKQNESDMSEKLKESNALKANIEEIEKKLANQRQDFNFIGLSDAFKNMKDNKQKELRHEKIFNWVLMGSITALLFLKICWLGNFNIPFINKLPNIEPSNTPYLVMVTISSIFLIAVLIYFFRISLINIKSIKSQILQLDLRLSLCQFIHNYAEDSEKMRKDNMKDSLDRFESIIFSPIVANEEQIPTTFDNLDQFIKMMNVANGGKGETK